MPQNLKNTQNSILKLKTYVNQLVISNNVEIGLLNLQNITGAYHPGYLYGNIKIHKTDSPLRLIISHVPTPIYQLLKTLYQLIIRYIPTKYSISCTNEFLQFLHSNKSQCMKRLILF